MYKISVFILLSVLVATFFNYQPLYFTNQNTGFLLNSPVPSITQPDATLDVEPPDQHQHEQEEPLKEVVQFPKLNVSYAEKTLLDIYAQVPSGYSPDLIERARVAKTGASPVYGELMFEAFTKLLDVFNATSEDVFLDLGTAGNHE